MLRPQRPLRQDGLGDFPAGGSLVRHPSSRGLATFRLHVGGQLLRLTEETAAPSMLRSLALVMCHRSRLRETSAHVSIGLGRSAAFDSDVLVDRFAAHGRLWRTSGEDAGRRATFAPIGSRWDALSEA